MIMTQLGTVGIFHVMLISSIPTPLNRRPNTSPGSIMIIKLLNKCYATLTIFSCLLYYLTTCWSSPSIIVCYYCHSVVSVRCEFCEVVLSVVPSSNVNSVTECCVSVVEQVTSDGSILSRARYLIP